MTAAITKALGIVEDVESENPWGEFHVILSTSSLDRDGEVIEGRAFEPLPDHITFDIDHGMDVKSTIGSGVPFYDDQDRLNVKGSYASTNQAQDVRKLVAEKHIRTTSVAFMKATRQQKDGVPTVTRAELLNGAFVAIPSNRDAVVLSAKSFHALEDVTEKVGARNSAVDMKTIQDAHDAMCALGAECALKAVTAESTKDAGTDPEPAEPAEPVVEPADTPETPEADPAEGATPAIPEQDEVVAADAAPDAAKAAPRTADAAEATEIARARLNAHRNAARMAFGK